MNLQNLWDDNLAPKNALDELVYVSRLLGSDPRITNFGGGNTSTKAIELDPMTGEEVEVLWVKASGGDLGSASRHNFASLYQKKVEQLEQIYLNRKLHEDEIVPLYRHCEFNLNPAAASIDTPLHALVPFRAVSHMHSDAVIAIAAAENCEELTQKAFNGEMGYLPWKRPGFELGLMLKELIEKNPGIKGAMMASHGFICWADNWEECYGLTIRFINDAYDFIEKSKRTEIPFGEVITAPIENADSILSDLLPTLRGKIEHNGLRLFATVHRDELTVDFVNRAKMAQLATLGTSCPDHFLRTKIRPLILPAESSDSEIETALEAFRSSYAEYYDRCKTFDSPSMRNPNPSVVLIPGIGMVTFGKNAQESRVTGEFFKNAIAVMKGAESISTYTSIPEQEAFNIEYWQLEEAKLRRQPSERELSRRVAVVSGGASGIGKATAQKLAQKGAHVFIVDINEANLQTAIQEVQAVSGIPGAVSGAKCDVTKLDSIKAAFQQAVLTFGGVDIVVANAGNALRGSVADTSEKDYAFQSDLLMKGYFDTVGEGVRQMLKQGRGGSIVIVGSKNGVAAGQNAALYSAAKAFELHLMRVTASDFAKQGIRCNAINPDGVVTGSGIWSDTWKHQTAKFLGIDPSELVDHYAKRSLLGTVVTPEDCAEAICWLASDVKSSRTTGCIIPVDGGNKEGFLR
jgi:rhamnulose-1-phosphate aldolase/alcohol dehydrogenase